MKLVQINRGDVLGGRFNGYSIKDQLKARGVESSHLVWDKTVADESVGTLTPFPGSRAYVRWAQKQESEHSIQSLLQLQGLGIALQEKFRKADVAHYHIIHDGYFSLLSLPVLSRLKPSVWTWHDPWIMTGHCVYPMDCERWQIGCGQCPDLNRFIPMKVDNTAFMFRQKSRITRNSPIDIILASQYMMNMAKFSPMSQRLNLHLVPFGVDLERYRPRDGAGAREALGIEPGRVVICIRAFGSAFKGLSHFVAALEAMQTDVPLCILSFQETGAFNRFLGRHQVVELGWVNDEAAIAQAYDAADVFAMPSTAEAFGVMAIEAMACGKPVVVFDGTSLSEVTFAPEAGVAAPMGDSKALAAILKRLIEDPVEREGRGRRSRELAERHYGIDLYADRLAKVYHGVHERARKSGRGRSAA